MSRNPRQPHRGQVCRRGTIRRLHRLPLRLPRRQLARCTLTLSPFNPPQPPSTCDVSSGIPGYRPSARQCIANFATRCPASDQSSDAPSAVASTRCITSGPRTTTTATTTTTTASRSPRPSPTTSSRSTGKCGHPDHTMFCPLLEFGPGWARGAGLAKQGERGHSCTLDEA